MIINTATRLRTQVNATYNFNVLETTEYKVLQELTANTPWDITCNVRQKEGDLSSWSPRNGNLPAPTTRSLEFWTASNTSLPSNFTRWEYLPKSSPTEDAGTKALLELIPEKRVEKLLLEKPKKWWLSCCCDHLCWPVSKLIRRSVAPQQSRKFFAYPFSR